MHRMTIPCMWRLRTNGLIMYAQFCRALWLTTNFSFLSFQSQPPMANWYSGVLKYVDRSFWSKSFRCLT